MANVDVTLKITNPALYNNLLSLVNSPHTVNINAIGISGSAITNFKQQLTARLGNTTIPITVTPTLGNANRLIQQIQNAIGNVSINVSIGNLAALSAQIANLFAGLGLQANFNPPRGNVNRGGNAVVRSLGGILSSQIRNEENPIDPRLGNVENALGVLSNNPGVEGIRNEEARRKIERAREGVARRQAKNQREFQQKNLFEIALLGAQGAAREFEEEKGLRGGTINTQGINRLSFDPARAFNTKGARNELGFSALFGGTPGAIGGAVGGGFFGEGGVFLGSAIFQKATETIGNTFNSLAESLISASKAGAEFQSSVSNISIALQATSKVVGVGGKEVGIGESIGFQNNRSRELLNKVSTQLAPFGVKSETAAAVLRGVLSGTSRAGLNLSDQQLTDTVFGLASFTQATNPDLAASTARLSNVTEDFTAGENTPNELQRSLLGSRVGPQLRSAVQSGDTEAFVKSFADINKIMKNLAETSPTFANSLGKVDNQFKIFERTFGDAFNQALIPGLNSFAKALNNPNFIKSLETLGKGVGQFINFFIEAAAKVTEFFSKNPFLAKTAVGATSGILPGAALGATAGFFTGGLPGAAIGGLAGGVIGAVNGAAIATSIPNIASRQGGNTNPNGLKAVPAPTASDLSTKLDALVGNSVDTSTISGKFQSDQAGLLSAIVSGKLSPALAKRREQQLITSGQAEQTIASLNIGRSSLELGALEQDLLPGRRLGTFQGRKSRGSVNVDSNIGGPQVLGGKVSNFATIIETLPPALQEFKLALNESTASLKELDSARKLDQLQGTDRLFELGRQIQEAGGSVPTSFARGFNRFDVGDSGKAGDRKLAILQSQFQLESNKLDPFRFDEESQRQKIAKERDIAKQQLNIDTFGANSDITILQKKQELLTYLGKFNDSELEDNIALPDAKGNIVSGKDLKSSLEKEIAAKFKTEVGSDTFKKITDKIGGSDPLANIEKKFNDLVDQLVSKIADGVKAGNDQSFAGG